MNPIEQGIGPINPFFMWYTVSRVGIWCTEQAFEVVSPSGSVADGTNIRLALEVPPKKSLPYGMYLVKPLFLQIGGVHPLYGY